MKITEIEQRATSLAIANKLSRKVFNISESRETKEVVSRIGVEISDGYRVEQDYFYITGDVFQAPSMAKALATLKFLNLVYEVKVQEPVDKKEVVKETIKEEETKEEVKEDVKPKRTRNAKPKAEEPESEPAPEQTEDDSNKKEEPKKSKAGKTVKYDNKNKDHTSVLASYLNSNFGDTWKTKENLKEFSSNLVGKDFRDEDGKMCESFITTLEDFFNA
jgi:hypothetical protein